MKKNRKKKGSIFGKLVASYFIFSAVAIAAILVCMFAELYVAAGGNVRQLVPSELVAEDGTLLDLANIYRSGGWVERLDGEYRVMETYGEKKTDAGSYTERELLALTAVDSAEGDYLVFWESFSGGSYLFFYPREAMRVTFEYQLDQVEMTPLEKGVQVFMVLLLVADGVLVSRYIYRKIRIPLSRLVEGMRRVKGGEQHVRISFRAEGEFVELQDSFNDMIERLEQEKLEKEKIQKDRHQMLLELSHDLKTPLATIKSCAAALEEGVVDQEELAHYYHTIAGKADRVNTMADDMFTMLKMESSDYQPELETADFCEVIRQICAEYYEEMEQAGLLVNIEIPEKSLPVAIDKRLIARMVGNLITNAIKYNKTGSEIGIAVVHKGGAVELVVADDGEPIAEDMQESMFAAFVRGDRSRRTSGGTGLGLAIAKGVVKKHGGDICYRYEEGWNQFVLSLPGIPVRQ